LTSSLFLNPLSLLSLPSLLSATTGEAGKARGDDEYDDDYVGDDAEAKASYTRQRRLSHVRTAVHREAEDKLDADFGEGKVETGKDSVAELVKECEDEGPAVADLLIACATRVGAAHKFESC
jgi:hypothetical protein